MIEDLNEMVSMIDAARDMHLAVLNKGQEPIKDYIYHYTSLTAGLNIIKTSKLRLTDIRYSNDPDEILSGLSLLNTAFYDVFGEMRLISPERAGRYAKLIYDINYTLAFEDLDSRDMFKLKDTIEDTGISMKEYNFPRCHVYVACFSSKSDDLRQWLPYANNGEGLALGFRTDNPKSLANSSKFIFEKVCYEGDKKKRKYVRNVLKEWWKILIDLDPKLFSEFLPHIFLRIVIDIVANKSKNYKDEDEWRLARMLSLSEEMNVSFHVRDNIARPYIEVDITDDIFDKIILGPKANFTLNAHCLRLAGNNVKRKIKTIPSKVHYRG